MSVQFASIAANVFPSTSSPLSLNLASIFLTFPYVQYVYNINRSAALVQRYKSVKRDATRSDNGSNCARDKLRFDSQAPRISVCRRHFHFARSDDVDERRRCPVGCLPIKNCIKHSRRTRTPASFKIPFLDFTSYDCTILHASERSDHALKFPIGDGNSVQNNRPRIRNGSPVPQFCPMKL